MVLSYKLFANSLFFQVDSKVAKREQSNLSHTHGSLGMSALPDRASAVIAAVYGCSKYSG